VSNASTVNLPGPLSPVAPAKSAYKVTASDTVDVYGATRMGIPCRALNVGTAGAADMIMADGVAVSAYPLQQGYNPIRVQRIKSTNLTAANIWALE
jgi:hypothetical protein